MSLFQTHKIFIKTDALTYKPGEEIHGTISFDFGSDSLHANTLTVSLFRSTDRGYNTSNNPQSRYIEENISEISLLGEWDYTKNEIPFSLMIPANAVEGKTDAASRLVDMVPEQFRSLASIGANLLIGHSRNIVSFYILVRLDIPWAVDVTEKLVINITEVEPLATNPLTGGWATI